MSIQASDFQFYANTANNQMDVNDFVDTVDFIAQSMYPMNEYEVLNLFDMSKPIPDYLVKSLGYGKFNQIVNDFMTGAGSGIYSQESNAVENGIYNRRHVRIESNTILEMMNMMRKANTVYHTPTKKKTSGDSTARVAYGLFGKEAGY